MDHKCAESETFAMFPVEVSKTSITTNCDHSKNYVRTIDTKFARLTEYDSGLFILMFKSYSSKIQALILIIESSKNIELIYWMDRKVVF